MLSPADPAARGTALIDTDAVAVDLAKLANEYAGRERELRTAVAQRLKAALAQGRAAAEEMLLNDRTAAPAPSASASCRTRSSA